MHARIKRIARLFVNPHLIDVSLVHLDIQHIHNTIDSVVNGHVSKNIPFYGSLYCLVYKTQIIYAYTTTHDYIVSTISMSGISPTRLTRCGPTDTPCKRPLHRAARGNFQICNSPTGKFQGDHFPTRQFSHGRCSIGTDRRCVLTSS